MVIEFGTSRTGFFNETIKVLNEKKLHRLGNHKSFIKDDTPILITHNFNKKLHTVHIKVLDWFAETENENYETALIDCVEKIDGQIRKSETKVLSKKGK